MSDAEEKEQQEQKGTEEKNEDWDKDRQRLDQADANIKKLSQEREQLTTDLESTRNEVKELKQQITAKQEEAELDPDSADIPEIIKELKALKGKLSKAETELKEHREIAKQYKKKEEVAAAETARKATIEKILKPLDKKYGARFRNEAEALAEKKIKDGKVDTPADALDARDLLESCYIELSEKEKKEKEKEKPSVQTDTGTGGLALLQDEKKHGTVAEVRQDMAKHGWFGKEK